MAAVLGFVGLHLTPPVREPTRDAMAVEARTLARANGLVLRALPRAAAGGPIGRAAVAFVIEDDASATRPQEGAGDPVERSEAAARLRRFAAALTRLRVVESVSLLVRPAGAAGGGLPAAWGDGLPSVPADAAGFAAAAEALLPDRLYVIDADDEGEAAPPLAIRPRRALPAGDER